MGWHLLGGCISGRAQTAERLGNHAAPQHLYADHQGSVVAVANGSGVVTGINGYDEYGIPNAANVGRFQYTGRG